MDTSYRHEHCPLVHQSLPTLKPFYAIHNASSMSETETNMSTSALPPDATNDAVFLSETATPGQFSHDDDNNGQQDTLLPPLFQTTLKELHPVVTPPSQSFDSQENYEMADSSSDTRTTYSVDDDDDDDENNIPAPLLSSTPPSSPLARSTAETQNNPIFDGNDNIKSGRKRKPSNAFEQTRFRDVIGHGAVKMRIEEMLLPLALPSDVAKTVLTGIRALPASILLYGPPGCGKTQLARSIAGEARAAFYCIAPSDILSKFVGESEAAVRNLFRRAECHARQLESKCAVVFLDEVDALGKARSSSDNGGGEGEGCARRVLAELLLELNRIADQAKQPHKTAIDDDDEANNDETHCGPLEDYTAQQPTTATNTAATTTRVIVVAATNRIDDCDPALLRRFGVRAFVGPPSKRHRKKMLQRHLSDVSHNIQSTDLSLLAAAMDNWSGSDIQSVAREAAMAPVRECIRAAVLRRKRATRREQQGASEETNPDLEARQTMIEGIQDLRPVSLNDFARAIDFFTTGEHQKTVNGGGGAFDVHYDSSSDEEDGLS